MTSRITLYGKPGCHLCDEARAVIERVCADAATSYDEVDITTSPELMNAYGTLHGTHSNLWPIWLEPDAQLRLANGRRLNISVTDLVEDVADFESTGPVGGL